MEKKLTHSGHHLPQNGHENSKSLLDPSTQNSFPVLKTSVSLNWWAISGLALACFIAGQLFSLKKQPQAYDLSQIEIQQQKIIQLMAERDAIEKNTVHSAFNEKSAQLTLVKLASDEIKKIVANQTDESAKIIREQREVIEHLKKQIHHMASIRPDIERLPASFSHSDELETIPYTSKNSSILWYEQKLEKETLVKKLEDERDTFLSTHDLKLPENKEKFQQLEKNHKLVIYELEQKHHEESRDFRQNKYRLRKKN